MTTLFTVASGLSFVLSLSILVLSGFSFTTFSFGLNTSVAGLTIIYHITTSTLLWRSSASGLGDPSGLPAVYTGKCMSCIILLFGAWIVALGIWIQVTIMGPHMLTRMDQHAPFHLGIQIAGSFLLALEALAVGSVMMHWIKRKRRAGEIVRAIHEKNLFLPSPVELQSARPFPAPNVNVSPRLQTRSPSSAIHLDIPRPAKISSSPRRVPPPQYQAPLEDSVFYNFISTEKNKANSPTARTSIETTSGITRKSLYMTTFPSSLIPSYKTNGWDGAPSSYVTSGPFMIQHEIPAYPDRGFGV